MVTLISNPKYYAVHLSLNMCSERTNTHEVCSPIRNLVESTLKSVISCMNYSFKVEYQLSFECPTHPGRDHLCIVNQTVDITPRFMLCLQNMKNPQPIKLVNQQLVWFEEVCSCTSTVVLLIECMNSSAGCNTLCAVTICMWLDFWTYLE